MGGGRSGLFPGAKGADPHQQTLFPTHVDVRSRGITYIPCEKKVMGCFSVSPNQPTTDKLHMLTVKEVLKKFMDYWFGEISEFNLVRWIRNILCSRHYFIDPPLRLALSWGLVHLENTKSSSRLYDHKLFSAELEKIEKEIALI